MYKFLCLEMAPGGLIILFQRNKIIPRGRGLSPDEPEAEGLAHRKGAYACTLATQRASGERISSCVAGMH